MPQIGIRDNFFNVGGTSIAAIKMAYEIGRAFSVEVPVRVILGHPTIEALGGWCCVVGPAWPRHRTT